ncbi:MAG: glucose 1-dehydrogenase [Planctomycetota bacterium]|nr:glucose 1-dehydrogenase [Planctomycetota bacterium]
MSRFDGKVIVVTGGSRGIGQAFSRAFATEGARVVVADLDADQAGNVAQEIDGLGVALDVADEASTAALARAALERYGRIDVLVNNAALWTALLPARPWTEIPVEEWDRVMAVNVRGCFLAARATVPAMLERGRGRIVNIASNTALAGAPGVLHYVTSKGAVIGFTRALARELGASGITVNAVAPGLVTTDATKAAIPQTSFANRAAARAIPREQVPEDLVGAVLFLASDEASFITGQVLTVDGGQVMY